MNKIKEHQSFKDSNLRSLVKGISWRIFASIDTFLLSWLIFGNYIYAGSIALLEILTKVVLYYLHERLWNVISYGRKPDGGVRHVRSIAKSISWRAIGTIDTAVLSLIVSGSLKGALTLGASEIFTKIALFYAHERIWSSVKWGRINLKSKSSEIIEK
jgi:uncharacterized membrane protein